MHVRWRREAALGRSRRRPHLVDWPGGAALRDDGGYGIWETTAVATNFAAALIFAGGNPRPVASSHPAVIVLSGLPGVGKSRLARELANQAAITVISSDRVRRILVADPTYSDKEHAFIHAVCLSLARHGLGQGNTVVLDSTNLRHQHRQRYQDLARRHHVPCHLVLLECDEAIVRVRLQRRTRGEGTDGSTADERVYEVLRGTVEPVNDRHVCVRGDGDVRAAARTVLSLLGRESAPPPAYQPATWSRPTVAGI